MDFIEFNDDILTLCEKETSCQESKKSTVFYAIIKKLIMKPETP